MPPCLVLGLSAAPPPARRAPMSPRCAASVDVVVVGAGLSGLSVASALCARGAAVALLEARPRVGGRLLTHTSSSAASPSDGGGALDLGATWRWPGESRVAALVQALGLPSFPHFERGDALAEGPAGAPQRLRESGVMGGPARFGGGTASLAAALAERLPPGVLRLSTPVERIACADAGVGLEVACVDGSVFAASAAVVVALPPALAAATLAFAPPLPPALAAAAAGTSTHMGGCAKTVVRYATPFWRDAGLSGAAFSRRGPLSEVHDHSGPGGSPAALLGFSAGGAPAREALLAQLVRLFGPAAAQPLEVTTLDWAAERYTAVPPGSPPQTRPMGGPEFAPGAACAAMGGRLLWAATETAETHAGHMEGALAAAERTVRAVEALLPPSSQIKRGGGGQAARA